MDAHTVPPRRPHPVAAVHALWLRHPRWALAGKAALAAALAWRVAVVLPAPFSEHPYYAPLGAVVAMSSTAVSSVRDSAQAIGAVLVGAAVARGVDVVLGSTTLSVALVVGLAMLCAGWRLFGEMGGWAVTSALFVLILGGARQVEFIAVFAGLIVVGAAIGVVVNLLLPPLPLTPSREALDRLRAALGDEAEVLADRLERSGPLEAEEWQRRRRELAPTIDQAHDAVARTREALRVNRRGRRYSGWASAQAQRAEALWAASDVVDDVVQLLAEWERADREVVAFGPGMRPALVRGLRTYAGVLRSERDDGVESSAVNRCTEALDELADAVRAARHTAGDEHFVAGTLVVTLRRGVFALAIAGRQG